MVRTHYHLFYDHHSLLVPRQHHLTTLLFMLSFPDLEIPPELEFIDPLADNDDDIESSTQLMARAANASTKDKREKWETVAVNHFIESAAKQ